MTRHELKTWPEPFAEVVAGSKTCELRKDDRAFDIGDHLVLREWNPATKLYSGRWIEVEVTYITRPVPGWGLEEGFCVMSIKPCVAFGVSALELTC